VETRSKGVIMTGTDAGKGAKYLETTQPGVLAIGRCAVTRPRGVGAALGESAAGCRCPAWLSGIGALTGLQTWTGAPEVKFHRQVSPR